MAKRIIVNVIPEEIRMALSEDGRLLEVAVERTDSTHMVGNIYKGRVENVLPGMQAAFINIGIGKNAFLFAGDIFPHKSFQRLVDEDNLTVGAEIMIEIVKDAMGTKGPRATTHFSIPGRYVVMMPSVDYVGVSRRVESLEERARLRALANKIRPKGMGVIVRTVAEGHSEEDLARDFQYLSNLWNALTVKAKRAKPPFLLYRDADLVVRIIRDYVKDDIDEVVIDNADAHARMVELAKFISPDLVKKIHLYKAKTDIFTHYAIEDEWNRLADRRVDLKCGGYLIIDKTEALTVIDVNTGRFTGHSNLADTVFRTNMEAAAEIARQLRLRDIGGIIVADFIDMQKEGHKKAILTELEARLKADNTKTNVLGLTELGLVEMTRKKARQTYEGTVYEGCPCCGGRGIIQSSETLVIAIRRQLRRIAAKRPGAGLVVQMHPRIAEQFGDNKAAALLEQELGIDLTVETIEGMQPEAFAILEGQKALVRSNEPPKLRKSHSRRALEAVETESGPETDFLSEEELAPLLAEKFAMEMTEDVSDTFESRLAAMTGSLWEPVLEPDDEESYAPPAQDAIPDTGTDAQLESIPEKPPRKTPRKRRSQKMTMAEANEGFPGKSRPVDGIAEDESNAAEETAVLAANPEKKSRRRRKPRREDEKSDDGEPVAAAVSEAEPSIAVEMPAATVKKTKRKRRRKKKPETEAEPAGSPELEPILEDRSGNSVTGMPEEESNEAAEPSETQIDTGGDSEKAAKKVKRRRRRKKKTVTVSTEATAAETTAEEEEPALPSKLEGSFAGEPAEIPVVKKNKRRRRKKKPLSQGASLNGEVVAQSDEPQELTVTPIAGEGSGGGAETEAPVVKKKRRRRRSNAKKKPPEGESAESAGLDEAD